MSLPKDNPFKNEPTIAKDIKRVMEGWVEGNAEDFLNENTISEGGMKAALADFMYSLPKAAIAEIKPLMKSKGGVAQQVMRLASITAILNKHGVAKKFMGFNAANLVNDYFDTFHGESVEVNELTNLRTYNNAYPNTMIASSKEMGEANDQSVKAAILILQSAANMASNPSKYGNLKIIGAIEQAIKQLKSASK